MFWCTVAMLLVRSFEITLRALSIVRACLHGGGGPQVSEVTRLAGVTRLSI